ncbi:hypothetical protein [Pseudomonas sp. Gutcm_11s]|uniref:hypothetical protein n=1 Tax=Pseudomonas sp. Gutcm_11s TaxID=3026088 RepID=UPI00235E0409|nr:hypothetical protein [Pseudomonas sp. Gutcm_11s]MDD0842648.1 hypothetical protein [Pseudomonas sp. Gutcm_11s]
MSQHDQDLQQEQQLLEHFREHSRGEPSAALDAMILAAAREAVAQPRLSWSQRLHAWLFGAGSRTRWSMAVAGLAVFGIGLNLTLHTREQLPDSYDRPAPAAAQSPALREMAPQVAGEAQPGSAEFEQRKAEAVEKKAAARQSIAGAMEPNASFSVSPAAAAAPRPMAPAKPQPAPLEAMADSAAASAELGAARDEARAKAQVQASAKAKAAAEARAQAPAGNALHEELGEDQLAETLGHSDVNEAPPLELQLHNVLRMRQAGQHADADRLLAMLKREYPQVDLDAELKRLQAESEGAGSSR